MFDKEFYPTPPELLEKIGIDCYGKAVLEPSAGKGNIVEWLKNNGASSVEAYEKNDDLRSTLQSKCKVLGSDFFEAKQEGVSHFDMIVMNPPFSNQSNHILHAFDIAPGGCEVIAICNATIMYGNSHWDRQIESLVSNYGQMEVLGQEFKDAERKTGVVTAYVRLFKPVGEKGFDFSGFYMDEEPEQVSGEGIMSYNEIRSIVNAYTGAVKRWDKLSDTVSEMNSLTKEFGVNIGLSVGYNNNVMTKADYSKKLQKEAWKSLFDKMNLRKYVTRGVMSTINEFVETQSKYPFTMKNIYRMMEIIVGTREQTMNKALEEAVDNFTKHTDQNRWNVQGWKTNLGHMLNKKFILDYVFRISYSGDGTLDLGFHSTYERIDDLVKVLCNITGRNYTDIGSLRDKVIQLGKVRRNVWYDWGFFQFKGFKKGTIHLKFKNTEDWYALNKAYGAIKGFKLPESYKK